jgi:Icc-related predicted phosphoesterase
MRFYTITHTQQLMHLYPTNITNKNYMLKKLFNKKQKIWHISDTHSFHNLLTIPEGIDIVIHSGDCSNTKYHFRNEPEIRAFIDWYSALPIKTKIYVAGNHDTSIEGGFVTRKDFLDNGILYLENDTAIVNGIKIFGSPYTPQFGQWAFMKARHKLDRIWKGAIEDDTHIIVVHGPPKGILDSSYDRNNLIEHCGDKSLMNRVMEVKPKLMLFGHIHNCKDIINAGTRTIPGLDTIFSNGSVVTDGKFGKLSSHGNIFEI